MIRLHYYMTAVLNFVVRWEFGRSQRFGSIGQGGNLEQGNATGMVTVQQVQRTMRTAKRYGNIPSPEYRHLDWHRLDKMPRRSL
jgi:hypothetical protein